MPIQTDQKQDIRACLVEPAKLALQRARLVLLPPQLLLLPLRRRRVGGEVRATGGHPQLRDLGLSGLHGGLSLVVAQTDGNVPAVGVLLGLRSGVCA